MPRIKVAQRTELTVWDYINTDMKELVEHPDYDVDTFGAIAWVLRNVEVGVFKDVEALVKLEYSKRNPDVPEIGESFVDEGNRQDVVDLLAMAQNITNRRTYTY